MPAVWWLNGSPFGDRGKLPLHQAACACISALSAYIAHGKGVVEIAIKKAAQRSGFIAC